MWSLERDRTQAEIDATLAVHAARVALPMEERIRLWCGESIGEEVEGYIDLIIAAEEEIRRLKGLPERTGEEAHEEPA